MNLYDMILPIFKSIETIKFFPSEEIIGFYFNKIVQYLLMHSNRLMSKNNYKLKVSKFCDVMTFQGQK